MNPVPTQSSTRQAGTSERRGITYHTPSRTGHVVWLARDTRISNNQLENPKHLSSPALSSEARSHRCIPCSELARNLIWSRSTTSRDQPLITNAPNPSLPVVDLQRIRAFPGFPIRHLRPILNLEAQEAAHGVRGSSVSLIALAAEVGPWATLRITTST